MFKETSVAGSDLITSTIWNNVQSNIGSEFYVTHGIQAGSEYYVYSGTPTLVISGLHYSSTGSWYDSYVYSGTILLSGINARNGKTTTSVYYYDTSNNISGIKMAVA